MSRHHARLIATCAALLLAACREGADRSVVAVEGASSQRSQAASRAVTPRDPGPPVRLRDGVVEAELAAARRAVKPEGVQDFHRLVRAFDQSRTVYGLNHLAGVALAILHHDPLPRTRAFRRQLARAHGRMSPRVTAGNPVLGYEGPGACDVDFDRADILGGFPDEVESTFTSPPHWSQECGNGSVYVEPMVFDHYHLLYEDASIDCIDLETGHFGRGDVEDCTPLADVAAEPRYAAGHLGDEVLRIQRRSGNATLPFTVHSFANVYTVPVKFRFRTGNGPWFQWNSLGGNTIWDVSAHVVGATEVQVTSAGTSLSCGPNWLTSNPPSCPVGAVYYVDDFSISP